MTSESKVQGVYAAKNLTEQEAAYDDWAQEYERDLCALGYRIPAFMAAMFALHIPRSIGPILDAGCGSGLQAEPLRLAGYRHITGLDLSAQMLKVAETKEIYDHLVQGTLGARLPFDDDYFAAVLSCGTITQGHAPAHSFDDLIRITKPGGRIIFTLRCDDGIDSAYGARVQHHMDTHAWTLIEKSPAAQTMPYGEPEVMHRGWVFQVN